VSGGGDGGGPNVVGGSYATVGGGYNNSASGDGATVLGGGTNIATGPFATVPGGAYNEAGSHFTFAAGHRAKANHGGAFVWADWTNADFESAASNEFAVRAAGGVRLVTGGAGATLDGYVVWHAGNDGTGSTLDADLLDGLDSTAFSLAGHSHDALYSPLGHNHDGIYALLAHDHDTRYYTQTQLNTGGAGGQVHWANLASVPADIADGDADTTYTNGTGLSLVGTEFSLTPEYADGSAFDGRFVNEGQLDAVSTAMLEDDAVTAAKIAPNVLSSLSGVSNDGGDIALVAGDGITITPDDVADAVTIAVTGGASWSLAGNAGTTAGTDFLGTTDNVALELKVNGQRTLRLEPATDDWTGEFAPNVIAGAPDNTVTAGVAAATVAGGLGNRVSGDMCTVAGGWLNTASDSASAVGGGQSNRATGYSTWVSGGYDNEASEGFASVGGGTENIAGGYCATIPGGASNTAAGNVSFAAGYHACANHAGAFVWADASSYVDFASSVANEFAVRAYGGVRLVTNGAGATLDGTLQTTGLQMPTGAADGYVLTSDALGIASWQPAAGGASGWSLTGNAGTTQGTNFLGTTDNRWLDLRANNRTLLRLQPGDSVVAGHWARSDHSGSFVWSDSTSAEMDPGFGSKADHQFSVLCTGGARFVTNRYTIYDYTMGFPIPFGTGEDGVQLAPGAGAWSTLSDEARKDNFEQVDGRAVLERLSAVPIAKWNYKAQDASIRHVGPTAQAFHAAFGVGEDNKHISTVDADGVALAAIQGLHSLVREKEAELADMAGRLDEKQAEITDLKARVAKLEALVEQIAQQTAGAE
jgi:hypothetical protein